MYFILSFFAIFVNLCYNTRAKEEENMEKAKEKIIIMAITSYYARQIFAETRLYEFQKFPLNENLLNKKIYVYSKTEDKAIIGYIRIKNILKGNLVEILEATGYINRYDGHELVGFFGKDNHNCYAFPLYDITEFDKYLTLEDMSSISKSFNISQYINYIYNDNPLYDVIKEWDEAFSLDGSEICPEETEQMILQRNKKLT